jgi:hypothetical protein
MNTSSDKVLCKKALFTSICLRAQLEKIASDRTVRTVVGFTTGL